MEDNTEKTETASAASETVEKPDPDTVYVKNLNPITDEKKILNFFSFCGKIVEINIVPSATSDSREAKIVFETPESAKTSLLLTNALLDEKVILVSFSDASFQENKELNQGLSKEDYLLSEDKEMNSQHCPPQQRSETSVIASLLASGYTLGENTLTQARAIDEQNKISEKLVEVANQTKESWNQLDEKYQISSTAAYYGNQISQSAKQTDENWKISESVANSLKTVSDTFEKNFQQARETPTVQNTVETVTPMAENVWNFFSGMSRSVQEQYSTLSEETNRNIEQQRAAAAATSSPSASSSSSSSSSGVTLNFEESAIENPQTQQDLLQ